MDKELEKKAWALQNKWRLEVNTNSDNWVGYLWLRLEFSHEFLKKKSFEDIDAFIIARFTEMLEEKKKESPNYEPAI